MKNQKNAKNKKSEAGTLPASLRLKKISKAETVFISDGLASNKHWIVSTAWLLKLPRRRDLGMIGFCNRIAKSQVAAVQARLTDSQYPTWDLRGIVNGLDLSEYRPAGPIDFVYGYIRGKIDQYDAAALTFQSKDAPFIDIEYAALAFVDTSTVIFYKDSKSPVILKNASGEVVACIAPLNPDKIKQYLKGN